MRLPIPKGVPPVTLSASEVNRLKQAPPVEGVLPEILNRWSPRSFSDRDVAPADLAKVFEAARWAASSYNEQPWRFLVGKRNSPTAHHHRRPYRCKSPQAKKEPLTTLCFGTGVSRSNGVHSRPSASTHVHSSPPSPSKCYNSTNVSGRFFSGYRDIH